MLVRPDGRMSLTGALMQESLGEVCNPLLTPDPENPGFYIDYWDYLANTKAGLKLNNEDKPFKRWFVRFLDMRGRWLNSPASASTIPSWMVYKGEDGHPFDIDDYDVPEGGFQTFNQFFLRNVKVSVRPLCSAASDPGVVVAPCDGGIFYLT
ncbi:MAG TPA: hypothetical protein VLQ93_01625 [Myxococcaceae bacterium]|nr:hypothetical protein [Myxococcaceae bacterium]